MDLLILLDKPNKILESGITMDHSIPQTKHLIVRPLESLSTVVKVLVYLELLCFIKISSVLLTLSRSNFILEFLKEVLEVRLICTWMMFCYMF